MRVAEYNDLRNGVVLYANQNAIDTNLKNDDSEHTPDFVYSIEVTKVYRTEADEVCSDYNHRFYSFDGIVRTAADGFTFDLEPLEIGVESFNYGFVIVTQTKLQDDKFWYVKEEGEE